MPAASASPAPSAPSLSAPAASDADAALRAAAEERFESELEREAARPELLQRAGEHAQKLVEGAQPLLPELLRALRCLSQPAPLASPPAPDASDSLTSPEACAYSAIILLHLRRALAALCDVPLKVTYSPRLAAVLRGAQRHGHFASSTSVSDLFQRIAAAPTVRPPLRVPQLPPAWDAAPEATARELRSPLEQRLWRNRQKMFDGLIALQRAYPNGQPATLDGRSLPLAHAARDLRASLVPQNGEWFARLLTQRLVASCLHIETDAPPPAAQSAASSRNAMAARDAGRLQRLSHRMSANPSGGRRGGGGSGGGGHGHSSAEAVGASWFPEATPEHFWFQLLVAMDSHVLASHLVHLWAARLWESATGGKSADEPSADATCSSGASPPPLDQRASASETADEVQRLLRCCVLARFLGLLLFFPQWELCVDGSASQRAALRSTAEGGRPLLPRGGFDVLAVMRSAECHGRLALCLPWVALFLEMLRDDAISRSLPVYRAAVHALGEVAKSPLLLAPVDSPEHPLEVTDASARLLLLVQIQAVLNSIALGAAGAKGEAEHRFGLSESAHLVHAGLALGDWRYVSRWGAAPLGEMRRLARSLFHDTSAAASRDGRAGGRLLTSRKITPTNLGAAGGGPPFPGRMESFAEASSPVLGGGSPRTPAGSSLALQLQALGRAPFWRQHRMLFIGANALLEPIFEAVCADARAESARGDALRSTRSAHTMAATRLERALATILPEESATELLQHALCELMPPLELALDMALGPSGPPSGSKPADASPSNHAMAAVRGASQLSAISRRELFRGNSTDAEQPPLVAAPASSAPAEHEDAAAATAVEPTRGMAGLDDDVQHLCSVIESCAALLGADADAGVAATQHDEMARRIFSCLEASQERAYRSPVCAGLGRSQAVLRPPANCSTMLAEALSAAVHSLARRALASCAPSSRRCHSPLSGAELSAWRALNGIDGRACSVLLEAMLATSAGRAIATKDAPGWLDAEAAGPRALLLADLVGFLACEDVFSLALHAAHGHAAEECVLRLVARLLDEIEPAAERAGARVHVLRLRAQLAERALHLGETQLVQACVRGCVSSWEMGLAVAA